MQTLQRLAVPNIALEVFPLRRQLVLEVDRVSVTYLEGSCQPQQGQRNQPVGSCWLQCVLHAQLSKERVLDLQVGAFRDVTLLWGTQPDKRRVCCCTQKHCKQWLAGTLSKGLPAPGQV